MKLYLNLLTALILPLGGFFFGCSPDDDTPPVSRPCGGMEIDTLIGAWEAGYVNLNNINDGANCQDTICPYFILEFRGDGTYLLDFDLFHIDSTLRETDTGTFVFNCEERTTGGAGLGPFPVFSGELSLFSTEGNPDRIFEFTWSGWMGFQVFQFPVTNDRNLSLIL